MVKEIVNIKTSTQQDQVLNDTIIPLTLASEVNKLKLDSTLSLIDKYGYATKLNSSVEYKVFLDEFLRK